LIFGIIDANNITCRLALYKEENIVPNLLNNLKKLEYPREKLQVFFLIEADDKATLQAVQAYNDIPWLQIFIIPIAAPRTNINVPADKPHYPDSTEIFQRL
jgi:cellulose synthase/poly-beta-1,6-N-acetylglucosamine synthase-like glycosyltransferase